LGSIPASSDTAESEGQQTKLFKKYPPCLIIIIKKLKKIFFEKNLIRIQNFSYVGSGINNSGSTTLLGAL
jgi:hypothetical protein